MAIDWNAENAAHLLRRAGFGPTPNQIKKAVKKGRNKTIESLFVPDSTKYEFTFEGPIEDVPLETLQAWWIRRMLATKSPLIEKLTLFWHNHFANANFKIQHPGLLHDQNRKIRKFAVGSFRKLLTVVSKSPAMILFLDNDVNIKGSPNENFAREVMELFTTGVFDKDGNENYSQTDVEEGARAFTGWTFSRDKFLFRAEDHDFGPKAFRGIQGDLGGEEVLENLATDPATARRIAYKLFRFFAYEVELDDPVLDELAALYLDHDTELRPMIERIFKMDAFYSEEAKYACVKSPAEFFIGAMHLLRGKLKGDSRYDQELGHAMRNLTQSIFDPPSVFGWKEGLAWVSSNGMLQRSQVGAYLADSRKQDDAGFRWKQKSLLGKKSKWDGMTAEEVVDRVLERLGPVPAAPTTKAALVSYLKKDANGMEQPFLLSGETADKKVRGLVAVIFASPEFQLV